MTNPTARDLAHTMEIMKKEDKESRRELVGYGCSRLTVVGYI